MRDAGTTTTYANSLSRCFAARGGAHIQVIADAPHLIPLLEPAIMNRILANFVARSETGAGGAEAGCGSTIRINFEEGR